MTTQNKQKPQESPISQHRIVKFCSLQIIRFWDNFIENFANSYFPQKQLKSPRKAPLFTHFVLTLFYRCSIFVRKKRVFVRRTSEET